MSVVVVCFLVDLYSKLQKDLGYDVSILKSLTFLLPSVAVSSQ